MLLCLAFAFAGNSMGQPSWPTGPYRTYTMFIFSPTVFTETGSPQGPNITPIPADATYKVTGTPSATAPGKYALIVTATGAYEGMAAVAWSITPAYLPPSTSVSVDLDASNPPVVIAFTIAAPGRYLVRAVGPGLVGLLDAKTAPGQAKTAPVLSLYSGDTLIAESGPWGGNPSVPPANANQVILAASPVFESLETINIATVTRLVGAFPLVPGSNDAALVVTLTPGVCEAQVENSGEAGQILIQIYPIPPAP